MLLQQPSDRVQECHLTTYQLGIMERSPSLNHIAQFLPHFFSEFQTKLLALNTATVQMKVDSYFYKYTYCLLSLIIAEYTLVVQNIHNSTKELLICHENMSSNVVPSELNIFFL